MTSIVELLGIGLLNDIYVRYYLKKISQVEEERKETVSIGTLTTADRDTWAKV